MTTLSIPVNKELFERAYLLGVMRERARAWATNSNIPLDSAIQQIAEDLRRLGKPESLVRALEWTAKKDGDPSDWDILTEQV